MSKVSAAKSYSSRFYDGLVNILSGLGTKRDRAGSNQHQKVNKLSDLSSFEAMYTDSSLCRKVVDIIPEDMCREWCKITDKKVSADQVQTLIDREIELGVRSKILEALKLNRMYGGSALIPVYADVDMSEPFDREADYGPIQNLVVSDPRYLTPSGIVEQDALKPNYLMPTHFTLSGSTAQIHHSWIRRMDGLYLPRYDRARNNYWGQSVLSSIEDDVNRALMVRGGISQLLDEVNLDVLSVKGLGASLAAGQKEQIQRRVEAYAQTKSLFRVIMVDADEQFSNRQISMSGMDAILSLFYTLVAGAADIPVTRLLGTSATGLNATGEGDIRNYYDSIAAKQEAQLLPILRWIYGMIGKEQGFDASKLAIEFPPLWQESGTEKESRLNARADRDQKYLTMGIVTESMIAKELQQDSIYSFLTDEHIAQLEDAVKELDGLEE